MRRKDLKVGDKFRYVTNHLKDTKFQVVRPNCPADLGFGSSSPESSFLNQEEEVVLIEPSPVPSKEFYQLTDKPQEDLDLTASPKPALTDSAHYTALSPEPIDVIEAWGLNFRLANVVKYVARHGRKPGTDSLDDLIKARNYLTREINAIRGKPSWLASA